ncbi:MAG: murein L,D-transpeptidase catalytic domain family protein [Elusimicrobia bacterium]|nr:murein L,D-transpeptidase catalytic domain family protein [Elusimicrobiota bacterium]
MNIRACGYPAAAIIVFCFLAEAGAQSPALSDLFGAAGNPGSTQVMEGREMPEILAPEDKAGPEFSDFSYIDPRKIVPKEPLRIALEYYKANRNKIENPAYLSIIDFTQHASKKRFYVIDMRTGAVEQFLVAHGRGSDPEHTGYASRFSNQAETHASSLGFYKTGGAYNGKHGYSLYLDGLSSTNSNARERAIVIHGADYVASMGRSWGCPAVEMTVRTRLIDMLKGGSIIYAFYQNFSHQ